jgi:hypothetical protein
MLRRDYSITYICKRFDISKGHVHKIRNQYKDVCKALDEKEKRRKEKALHRKIQ